MPPDNSREGPPGLSKHDRLTTGMITRSDYAERTTEVHSLYTTHTTPPPPHHYNHKRVQLHLGHVAFSVVDLCSCHRHKGSDEGPMPSLSHLSLTTHPAITIGIVAARYEPKEKRGRLTHPSGLASLPPSPGRSQDLQPSGHTDGPQAPTRNKVPTATRTPPHAATSLSK